MWYQESLKKFFYLAFALILLIMNWESNRSMAAVVDSDIPQESIRIRILANSDSVEDQYFKRKLQESIVSQVSQWAGDLHQIDQARMVIQSHLSEIEQLTADLLQSYDIDYEFQVELDEVPFPEKRFGKKIYPAGSYEALRVTLGEGKGQNWWCVLFPPLCFVDVVAREPFFKKAEAKAPTEQDSETDKVEVASVKTTDQPTKQTEVKAQEETPVRQAEVRFFLLDLIDEIVKFFRNWFV